MDIEVQMLGRVQYLPTYRAMQEFTANRSRQLNSTMKDQLWICEHFAVYTQGLSGKAEHIFNPQDVPVIATDRGGQVTYHGPGQVVAYPLINLQRAGYFVKEYVYRIEEALIKTLLHFGITGHRVAGAPGIYVRLDDPRGHAALQQKPRSIAAQTLAPAVAPDFTGLGKIAALGIKVSQHCTYHGLALNVNMDLEPFRRINPCGYVALQTVDLSTIGVALACEEVAEVLTSKLQSYLAA